MARGPFKPQSLYCCSPSSGSPGTFSQTMYNPLNDSSLKLFLRRSGPFYSNIDGTGGTPAAAAACGRWGDSSGQGNHFSAAANDTTRPVVAATGLRGLSFDGVNDVMFGLASLDMTTAWTLFILYSSTVGSANKGIMGRWGAPNQWALLPQSASSALNQESTVRNSGDSANFSATTPTGNNAGGAYHCIGMQFEAATTSLITFVDNGEVTNSSVTSIKSGTGSVSLGSYFDAAVALQSTIVEVLLFNRAFTAAERVITRNYMGL